MIQIASMVTEHGSDAPLVRNVMTLGSCAPIVGSEVMSFASEEELLKARATASLGVCLSLLAGAPSAPPACHVHTFASAECVSYAGCNSAAAVA